MSIDSATYDRWSDALLRVGFDYGAFLAATSSLFPPTLYTGFVTLVALLKLAAGAHWGAALVALNLLSTSLLAALLVQLAWRLTGSRAAAAAALLLDLACPDLTLWTPFALSDTTFLLLAFAPLALLADALVERRRPSAAVVAALLAISAVSVFYRPTGVLALPGTLAGLGLTMVGAGRLAAWTERRPWLPGAAVGGSVLLGGLALALHAWWMQDPARWPFRAAAGVMRFNASHYRLGEVVWERPSTFHAAPSTYPDFLAITADRLGHFLSCCSGEFSVPHNLVAAAFLLPTYALAAVGVHGWLVAGAGRDAGRRAVVFLCLLTVLAFTVFHAAVQVDYDWRYRVPIFAPLIVLAACGVGVLAERRGSAPREPSR